MAQVQGTSGSVHNGRPAPNRHSDELQERKRREKMQAHSSSHGSAGAARQSDAKDAPN